MKRGPGKPERVDVRDGAETTPCQRAASGVAEQIPRRPCLAVLEPPSGWLERQRLPSTIRLKTAVAPIARERSIRASSSADSVPGRYRITSDSPATTS